MLENNDIEKDINKCSRCALCIQNCPIYDIKKDENNTSRGLICKLLGYNKKILTKKEIKKDLRICLACSKCKKNCPSKIDTIGVFSYFNFKFCPSKINQKIVLLLKFLPIRFVYFINLFKKLTFKPNHSKISYFKGCMACAQHKITFLDRKFRNIKFACCGLPYLTSGDIKSYNEAKRRNIKLIKNSDKVIFDCASCISAVREYDELDEKDKNKLILFSEILNKKGVIKKTSKYKDKIMTFHKPCHMSDEEFLHIENFLNSIDEIKYKRLENYDSCCGFGGSYFMFHPIISSLIALKKSKTIKNSNADLILTSCPACTLGIRFGQLISFNFKKTLELRDFIETEFDTSELI